MVFPGLVRAQDSSFVSRAQSNLAELAHWQSLRNLPESDFTINQEFSFSEAFSKSQLSFFKGALPDAHYYFNFLSTLNSIDKQHLLFCFAEIETDLEQELTKAGLSADWRYLPAALSMLNPNAKASYKRLGIWQLTHFQAVLGGLQLNRLVDERLNCQMASAAAVKQLVANKLIYSSEELAVLAFEVGNTKLKNTLACCGEEKSPEQILALLPNEVHSTIAMFQAFAAFFSVNKAILPLQNASPDTVWVNRQTHFKQIAQSIAVSENELSFLNPQYRYAIVPANEKGCRLLLPKGKHDAFVFHADSIFYVRDSSLYDVLAQKIEYPPAPNRQYVGEKVKELQIEGKTKLNYTIKSGDVLGFIAEEYDVRVADLKYWNNIYNERKIQAGKVLDIFVDNAKADYYLALQKQEQKKETSVNNVPDFSRSSLPTFEVPKYAKKVEHVVKSGDSPYLIAKKYKGVTAEEILQWNGIKDARKIQIGQKLIIYLQQ